MLVRRGCPAEEVAEEEEEEELEEDDPSPCDVATAALDIDDEYGYRVRVSTPVLPTLIWLRLRRYRTVPLPYRIFNLQQFYNTRDTFYRGQPLIYALQRRCHRLPQIAPTRLCAHRRNCAPILHSTPYSHYNTSPLEVLIE